MAPLRVTDTVPPLPAAPPKPPTEALMSAAVAPGAGTFSPSESATLMPPLPPPPPIDCASTPSAWAPSVTVWLGAPATGTDTVEPVEIEPVELTVTALASPAAPPTPPTVAETTAVEPPDVKLPLMAPAKLNPPLP